MGFPIIIAEGHEGLFIIIVVISSIVGRILKARSEANAKQAKPRPRRPSGGSATSPRSPDAELREFFENLAQGRHQTPESPPVPPTPQPKPVTQPVAPVAEPKPVARPARAAVKRRPTSLSQTSPVRRVEAQPPPAPQPVRSAVPPMSKEQEYRWEQGVKDVHATSEESDVRHRLHVLLQGKEALRDAILLREILGPPLALRSEPIGGRGK